MRYLSPEESARVWTSLDDNLRSKIRSGELTIEEAARYVVPIGDNELREARAAAPARGLDALPEENDTYSTGDAVETGFLRAGQSVDTIQMGTALGYGAGFRRSQEMQRGERPVPFGLTPDFSEFEVGDNELETMASLADAMIIKPIRNLSDLLDAAFFEEETLANMEQRTVSFSQDQIAELQKTRDRLAALPPNTVSQAFIDAVDAGDYWTAAKNWPAFAYYTTLEQTPALATGAAITGGTALTTRNPAATLAAARASGAIGSLTELGSDYESILEGYTEEERNDPVKLLEAYHLAQQAVAARGLIETMVPGSGYGKVLPTRIASLVAGQMASEAGGEYAAATVKGQDITRGELVAEATGGLAQTAVESGGIIRQTLTQRRLEAEQRAAQAAQANAEFAAKVAELDAAREREIQFNAEQEAERAIQSLRDSESLNRGDQMEMPFGSGEAGTVRAENVDGTPTPGEAPKTGRRIIDGNDRTPTIVDMFTGESVAATKAEERRAANVEEAAALAEGRPNLTDEEFEVRSQRTSDARRNIDERQQNQFETQKQKENNRRKLQAEDRTVLKNERSLLSTADITREAKRLVDAETAGLRKQRAGIYKNPKKLDAVVKAYERQRLPELVEAVRNRRLARVNAARDREIAEDNRQMELEDIEIQNELAARQDAKAAEAKKAKEVPADDLFDNVPGQRSLNLAPQAQPASGYTGVRTPESEATDLAAGQLQRQKLNEKLTPEQKAKQSAAIEAEIPSVEKAVQAAETKKVNLTVTKYAAAEKAAIREAVKAETSVPNDTRTVEEKTKAAAKRVAEWRKANPKPTAAPDPKAETPLAERAKEIAEKQQENKKRAETRRTNDSLRRKIAAGATPEEAAEEVENEILTRQQDAALRSELGEKGSRPTTKNANKVFLGENHPRENLARSNTRVKAKDPDYYEAASSELEAGTATPTSMLNHIINSKTATLFHKQLAARLKPLIERLGTTMGTGITTSERAAGQFRPSENKIYLDSVDPVLVLHETLHAVLVGAMHSPKSLTGPGLTARVRLLTNTIDRIRLEAKDFLNDGSVMTKTGELTKKNLGDTFSENGGPLANNDEFIAYFMTEPNLQFLLDQLPANRSFVAKITDWAQQTYSAILRFLGMEPNTGNVTALQELFSTVDKLLLAVEEGVGDVAEINARNARNARSTADALNATADVDIGVERPFSNPTVQPTFKRLGFGAMKMRFKPEWKTNFLGTLVDKLTSGAGASKAISETFDRSQSSTTALISTAEQLYRTINFALEKQAKETGVNEDVLREKMVSDIESFEQDDSRLGKAAKARGLRNDYGLAARAYFTMRRTIDKLSNDILQQRLADPRPFTKGEAKIYKSIRDNMGQYYTRVYANNIKGVGEKRAKALWAEYTKRAQGDMNPEWEDGYQIVRKAVEFVRDQFMMIPDVETMMGWPMTKLDRVARAWGVIPGGAVDVDNPLTTEDRREELVARLHEVAQSDPDHKDQKALELVEDMLMGDANSVLMSYYRGGKQDRTIVTERQHVPEEIRNLLGEVADKFLRGVVTITRQAEFRARAAAANELLENLGGDQILTDEEFTARKLSTDDWKKLKGPGYGILRDKWVRLDLARRLEDSAEVERSFNQAYAAAEKNGLELAKWAGKRAIEGWAWTAGKMKLAQLVLNPANVLMNFGGGFVSMVSNGTINPQYAKRALATAWDLIKAQREGGNNTKDMEKVIRAGITDSAFMGEIKAVELDQLRRMTMDALNTKSGRVVESVKARGKTAFRSWREAYAMADVVWKIANFYAEEARLTEYHKLNGTKISAEQIERDAAWNTNVSNFSYKRVPNFIKNIEKSGLTYIMPYIYETFRAPIGSLFVGLQQMNEATKANNKEAAQFLMFHGAKRATGAVMAMGILQTAMFAAIQAAGKALGWMDEDEEEWVEDLKALVGDHKKFSDFLYMGDNDEGEPVLAEFSRLDPMGPATEFYRMLLSGPDAQEFTDAAKRLLIENPYGGMLLQAAFGGSMSTNTRLAKIDPATYSAIVQSPMGVRGAKVIDTFLPSVLTRALDPENEAPKDDIAMRFLTNIGLSVQPVDIQQAAQFEASRFANSRADLRQDFYTFLKTSPNMTDEELLAKWSDLQQEEVEHFERIERLYNGMVRVGVEPERAIGILKAEDKLTNRDLGIIYSGGYFPAASGIISKSGLETSYGTYMKDDTLTTEQKQRYYDNIMRVVSLVESGQLPSRE